MKHTSPSIVEQVGHAVSAWTSLPLAGLPAPFLLPLSRLLVACHNMCVAGGLQVGGMDARLLRVKILSVYAEADRRLAGSLTAEVRLSLLLCRQEVAVRTSGLFLSDVETARSAGLAERFAVAVLSRGGADAGPPARRLRLQALWLLTHVMYPFPQEHVEAYALFRRELSVWAAGAADADPWPGLPVDEWLWRTGLLNRAGYMFLDRTHDGLLSRLADRCLHLVPALSGIHADGSGTPALASLAYMVMGELHETPAVREAALSLGLRLGRSAALHPAGSYGDLLCAACGVEAGCEWLEERWQECV